MSQRETIVGSSLLLWIVAVMAVSPLGAADRKTEQANWDNLKTLTQGQEIKVVLNDVKAYKGLFQSVSDDGIAVALPTGNATFGRQDILRVSTKTHGHRLRNTALGAAIGGGSFAGVGGAVGDSSGDFGRGGTVLLGLIGGSAIGAAVGAVMPTEGWRDVYRVR